MKLDKKHSKKSTNQKTLYKFLERVIYKGGKKMNRNTALILWTIAWLIFIGTLCFLFKNANPLWLLIIWILGFGDDLED